MFIAMNRFKVRKGEELAFETRWRERDTHLHTVPGFVEFHLLKGPERDDYVLYASHTIWHRPPISRRGPARKPYWRDDNRAGTSSLCRLVCYGRKLTAEGATWRLPQPAPD